MFKFLGLIIKQNPTPQLNVFSISLSLTLFFFIHLKILRGLILLKITKLESASLPPSDRSSILSNLKKVVKKTERIVNKLEK